MWVPITGTSQRAAMNANAIIGLDQHQPGLSACASGWLMCGAGARRAGGRKMRSGS